MTTQRQEEWFSGANGRPMNPDNSYGRQCKDCPDDYCIHIFGDWVHTIRPGDAHVVFGKANDEYFVKIANDPNDPNQLPPRGAILCYDGWSGNSAGHILVLEDANANTYTGIEQDGFTVVIDAQGRVLNQGVPAYRVTRPWSWHAGSLIGWLIPRPEKMIGYVAPQPVSLLPFQRRIRADAGPVNVRISPNTEYPAVDIYHPTDVIDFSGWVSGQSVDGNTIWFKGKYRDVYMTAAAFEDQGTHDLVDLNPTTPPVALAKNERTVVDGGLNLRQAPHTNAAIIRTIAPGKKVTIRGYVRGMAVDSNDIWFDVTTEDGDKGLVWSGGTNSTSLDGLDDVTPLSPTVPENPTEPTIPTYPEPTNDPAVTKVFNKKHPLYAGYVPDDLVIVGNGNQQLRREAAASLVLMSAAAKSAGVTLSPQSGFRSYDVQKDLFNSYVAKDGKEAAERYSARPGYSEHQTGLAIDFAPIEEAFAKSDAYYWLIGNAHKFGFVLRYPQDAKETITGYMYEPWHWRYVGVDTATDMHQKNITTLEEYYGIEGGDYPDNEKPDEPPQPDPETPSNPPEPAPPVPTPEAAASATKFVTRLGTQLATVALAVNGLAGLLQVYTGIALDSTAIGWITVIGTLILIGAMQFGYKVGSSFRWPF